MILRIITLQTCIVSDRRQTELFIRQFRYWHIHQRLFFEVGHMFQFHYILRVCPSERFLDPPPPINFVHDQISIYLVLFRVRLG